MKGSDNRCGQMYQDCQYIVLWLLGTSFSGIERFSKLFACSAIACIKLNNETILTNSVSNVYKEHGSVLLNKFKQFAQLDNYLPGHNPGDSTKKLTSSTSFF